MQTKQTYKVVGLMSGTSLDGLDLASCTFSRETGNWVFTIDEAVTLKYPARWQNNLAKAHLLSSPELLELDADFGKFLGEMTLKFLRERNLKADFIASHGHTVFHQPSKGFTFQMGNGNALHAVTGLPVIYDFRSLDVILGGQGAPLVPAGDKHLFYEYEVCLNLGGIANLSMDLKKQRIAYDVCFANMGLNFLAAQAGKKYDKDGKMAGDGEVDRKLLKQLDNIYSRIRKKRPSLGRELFESSVEPLLSNKKIPLQDRLRTFTESIAKEIVLAVSGKGDTPRILCTGGGAFNSFLISRMLELFGDEATLILPEDEIIKFKEAMVFGFLGVLRVCDEPNCLKSVTGASRDSSSGILVGF